MYILYIYVSVSMYVDVCVFYLTETVVLCGILRLLLLYCTILFCFTVLYYLLLYAVMYCTLLTVSSSMSTVVCKQ